MNNASKLRIITCLALLFTLGGVCGFATSRQFDPSRPAWTRSPQWAERWLERRIAEDFARLEVTPEQEARLRPIYDRLLSDFNAIQQESQQKVTDAFKRHGTDLWKQLTPEQRERQRAHQQTRAQRKAATTNAPTP